MGKTALLIELADLARKKNYVVARVTAYDEMPDEIIETIQREGAKYINDEKRQLTGFNAEALGFSIGLTFSEATQSQYGFRTKLTLLCDRLEEYGKGVLVLVDEACTSDAMRQVAVTYQHLVGEGKNIALCMAGLPHAVSGVLNDKVLTFLNRAHKVKLGPISTVDVGVYYARAFQQLGIECKGDLIERAALASHGFPYLMQLIGFYLVQRATDGGQIDGEILDKALEDALTRLHSNVFDPILAPLSDNDRKLLEAMAQDDGVSTTANLKKRLGIDDSILQPYRKRLIDAGVIESPRRGELVFAVPHLAEYLRETTQ